ncbi:MAG: pantetheine-phosphate adenylyltransferase, partial [Candidatus Diapherotrites archaeon]|nr:pantetheine-phosphate adenylyltransferase [Candidatus Diapherotrites archaeon]
WWKEKRRWKRKTWFLRSPSGHNGDSMKVCVGGTFNRLHEGHQRLIDKAFSLSDHVVIGVTTDAFAKKLNKEAEVRSFEERVADLNLYTMGRAEIVPIEDVAGPVLQDPAVSVLVTSTETYRNAFKINEDRVKLGMKPVLVVVIPLVKNAKGLKLSSTALIKDEQPSFATVPEPVIEEEREDPALQEVVEAVLISDEPAPQKPAERAVQKKAVKAKKREKPKKKAAKPKKKPAKAKPKQKKAVKSKKKPAKKKVPIKKRPLRKRPKQKRVQNKAEKKSLTKKAAKKLAVKSPKKKPTARKRPAQRKVRSKKSGRPLKKTAGSRKKRK